MMGKKIHFEILSLLPPAHHHSTSSLLFPCLFSFLPRVSFNKFEQLLIDHTRTQIGESEGTRMIFFKWFRSKKEAKKHTMKNRNFDDSAVLVC